VGTASAVMPMRKIAKAVASRNLRDGRWGVSNKLYEKMWDANLRIDAMYFVCHDDDLVPHELTEELEYMPTALGFDEDEDVDYMLQKLHGKLIAKVSTPIREKGKSSYSWGWTTMTLIAAPTFEEIVEKACEWAETAGSRDSEEEE